MSKTEALIPLFAILGNFAAIIVFIYFYFTSRHRERMALIESGKDATIFKREKDPSNRALKYGMVAVMSGIGLLIGAFMKKMGMPGEVAYFSMVLIFGGMGLLAYYFSPGTKKESDLL